MRRKKRSSFPFISLFILCILLFALLGLVQSKDTSALISVLQEFLPEPSPTTSDDDALPVASALYATSSASAETTGQTSPDSCYAYYYQQLSAAEQTLYTTIYTGVSDRKDTIDLNTTDTDTVHRIYHFVL